LERELDRQRQGRAVAERDADYLRSAMELLRNVHPAAAMAVAESKERRATILIKELESAVQARPADELELVRDARSAISHAEKIARRSGRSRMGVRYLLLLSELDCIREDLGERGLS
jgi:hypothetical protein